MRCAARQQLDTIVHLARANALPFKARTVLDQIRLDWEEGGGRGLRYAVLILANVGRYNIMQMGAPSAAAAEQCQSARVARLMSARHTRSCKRALHCDCKRAAQCKHNGLLKHYYNDIVLFKQ